MTMPRRSGLVTARAFPLLLLLTLPTAALIAQADSLAPTPSLSVPELVTALADLAGPLSLRGAGLAVGHGAELLHCTARGDFAVGARLPIASASKWLCVATILTLVDDGTLDLDLPLVRYLDEFDRPDKRDLTLRQCLSCTAGFHQRLPAVSDRSIDMTGLAKALADYPLQSDAGLEFSYSGLGFQAAACAAERRTGRSWHRLFADRIAAPLGLTDTLFGRLVPAGADAGTTEAPWVAGGAVSTLRDYERFARMLAQRGEFEGKRVLAAASVDRMFESRTRGMTVRFPGFEGDLAYGLGTWLQTMDGGLVRGSDPGAFGFLPWIDRDQPGRAIYGVIAVEDRIARVLPRAAAVQAAARAFVASPVVSGIDEVVQLEHGGRTRRYLLHRPPNADQAQALPLVVVLHGGGGNGAQVAEVTGFSRLADAEGFAVVYPDGTGRLRNTLLTWNSGGIPVYAADQKVDDVGFLIAVVEDAKTKVAVDPERVYATGMSNGGMMCHRLAREADAVFAAIAPVSGAMNFTAADSGLPIDVMIVHGTADEHVRFGGGEPGKAVGRAGNRTDASVDDAVKYYRARNGLADEPESEREGPARIDTWTRSGTGGARLRLVTIDGGGHAWPGGKGGEYRGADAPTAWDATAAIWQFFKGSRRHRAPR